MLDRRYRRSKSDTDRLAWIQQLKQMRNLYSLYHTKRHQYWCTMIADNRGDMKKFWCTFSAVAGRRGRSQPSCVSSHTAEGFVAFFTDKIAAVRADTEAANQPDIKVTASDLLSSLSPLNVSEVRETDRAICQQTVLP